MTNDTGTTRARKASSRITREWRGTRYGRAALASAVANIDNAGLSGCHDAIRNNALAMGNLVAGNELERSYAHAELVRAGIRCGKHRAEVERTVAWGLAKGEEHPRSAPPSAAIRDVDDARLELARWGDGLIRHPGLRGQVGATLLRIAYGGFWLPAHRAGKLTLADSVREVAANSGVNENTVSRYSDALGQIGVRNTWRAANFAQRLAGARSTWRIEPRALLAYIPDSYAPALAGMCDLARHPLIDPSLNVWHRRACDWRVFAFLTFSPDPLGVAEIAAGTMLSPRSLPDILGRLTADGLADRDVDVWSVVPDAVEPPSLVDHKALRADRYARDREALRAKRAEVYGDSVSLMPHARKPPIRVAPDRPGHVAESTAA